MKKWRLSFVAMTLILASSLAPAAAQQEQDGVVRVPEGAELRATMDGRTAKVKVDHHPIALHAVGADGQPIDKVAPGRPFRVEARFNVERPAKPLDVIVQGVLTAPRRPFGPLVLSRTEDAKVFRSGLLAIRPQAGANDRLGFRRTQPGYDAQKSARVAADNFAGQWRVVQVGERGPGGSGTASIAADGSRATLTLRVDDRERRYRSRELDAAVFADRDPTKQIRTLSVRFEEETEEPSVPAEAEKPTLVDLATGRNSISFAYGARAATLALDRSSENSRIRVTLREKSANQLEGGVSDERNDRDLVDRGRHAWSRGTPRIDNIVVLEDQLARPKPGSPGILSTTAYPFGSQGDSLGARTRTLFIYGQDLPDHGDIAQLASLSRHLTYEPEYSSLAWLKQQGWAKAALVVRAKLEPLNPEGGSAPLSSLTALVVRAKLEPGVTPGSKELTVNGASGIWHLLFNNQLAILRFVREGGDARTDATNVFYTSDIAFAELVYNADIPFAEVQIELLEGGEEGVPVDVLTAKRVAEQSRPIYRTGPIHFFDANDATLSPPADATALRIGVQGGQRFTARLNDPAEGLVLPPPAFAEIHADPTRSGPGWADAVRRAAACYDGTIGEKWAQEEAMHVSRRLLTERLRSRNVRLVKGDHAAAILVRDEFVAHARELAAAYLEASRTLGTLRAFRARAIASGTARNEPLWTESKAKYVVRDERGERVEKEVALWETLDAEHRPAAFGMQQTGAELWALEQTRLALHELYGKMQQAIARATAAGDCALEELLVLAGQGANPVVARILPRLVKAIETGRPPRRHWAADRLAQAAVKGLHTPAAAVRALKEYAAIDDAYKSMAVALATGGTALLVARAATSAATLTLVAGDVADAAYFGTKGILQYREGEANYDYARGAAPVMGLDFLEDARAARQSGLMTAVGVIAPGVGGAMGLKHLKNARTIQRGKDLLGAGRASLDDIARLSPRERTDLAAYYTDLLGRRQQTGAGALSAADKAALAQFEGYLRRTGVPQPSTAKLAPAEVPGTPAPSTAKLPAGEFPGSSPSVSKPLLGSEAERARLKPGADSSELDLLAIDLSQFPRPPRSEGIVPPSPPSPGVTPRDGPGPRAPPSPPATVRYGDADDITDRFGTRLFQNESLGNATVPGIRDPRFHVQPNYRQRVEALDETGDAFTVDGVRYRRASHLNPVPPTANSPTDGRFADVYAMADDANNVAPFVAKRYGERTPWEQTPTGLRRTPSLDSERAHDIEMADDIEYGAGLLERHGIPQAEIAHVEYRGRHPVLLQRRLGHNMPADVVAEETWKQAARRLGLDPTDLDRAWQSDRFRPQRMAVLKQRRKMADDGIGWEDGHPGNFFFQNNRQGGVRMAVSDTDRMDYVRELDSAHRIRRGRMPEFTFNNIRDRVEDGTPRGWKAEVAGRAGPGRRAPRQLDVTNPHHLAIASLWHKGAFSIDSAGRLRDGWLKVDEIRDVFGDHFRRLLNEP